MKLSAFTQIVRSLEKEQVRYLLVGGLAVVAHGYGRMTLDVDLVVQLERENVLRAFQALSRIGYKPRVPVTAAEFADRETRGGWIRDKGMVVLNLWSESCPDTPVDLFVSEPFDFDRAYEQAPIETLEDGTSFRFADIPTLIAMKKLAGREKDLDDIRHLEAIAHDR